MVGVPKLPLAGRACVHADLHATPYHAIHWLHLQSQPVTLGITQPVALHLHAL